MSCKPRPRSNYRRPDAASRAPCRSRTKTIVQTFSNDAQMPCLRQWRILNSRVGTIAGPLTMGSAIASA